MKTRNILLLASTALIIAAFSSCGKGGNSTDDAQEKYGIRLSESSTINKAHKNVLIISASPRRGGNTDMLCDEFARGAKEAGGNVEKIFLGDYDIKFFSEEDERHVGDSADVATDDAPKIVRKMLDADIIVLSSPVYFMNIDGQLKTLIDRTYSHFMDLKDKEFYYITACADREESTADFAITGFRGFVMCLPNPTERGMVKATGVGAKGGVKHTGYMEEAYKLGKSI